MSIGERRDSSEDARPKPPPPQKVDLVPTTAHTMAVAAGLVVCFCLTITLFGGPWQWAVVGPMFGSVLGIGAHFKWKLDKANAAAMRQKATPPANGWRGRGDGPGR